MKVVIIDYGAGNTFSVTMALKRLGIIAEISSEIEVIRQAERVIFPGVGQASAAMEKLKASRLDWLIPQLKMPVLGICLGMQLMCSATEEENTKGLGIFPVEVRRFTGRYKIPHMGWNNIWNLNTELFKGIAAGTWMYFVHSYYMPENEYTVAGCEYGPTFSAAIRKDNFYGCQFHPEKSAAAGEKVLKNFLEL